MTGTKYKAAIIGTGRIGYLLQKDKKREQPASHASALFHNKRISLSAGCDLDRSRLISFKKDYPHSAIYTDYKKMLNEIKPDIIVISAEEKAHLKIASDAVDCRPYLIILEKPVSPNLADAYKIQKKAEEKKIPFCINHERRFSLDYIEAKKTIKKGIIGKVQSVYASLNSGSKVWHAKAHIDGSCSLIHDATHMIDIMHFLLDCRLTAPSIDKTVIKNKAVTELIVHYLTDNKTAVYLEINGTAKYFGFEIQINGSKGKIIIGNGYFKLYTAKSSPYYADFFSLVKDKKTARPAKTKYFANMVQNCIDHLDKKTPLVSPLSEGIKTMEAIYDIVKKIKRIK